MISRFKCKFCFGVLRLKIIIPCVRLFVLLLKINVNAETSSALCGSAQRTDLVYGRLWQEVPADSRDDKRGNAQWRWSRNPGCLDGRCLHRSVRFRAPSTTWTSLIVSDSEVALPGRGFVLRRPASTLFALLLVLNAACQVRRAGIWAPGSRTNCFILAFCLEGQKVRLARKPIISPKGWEEKNAICAPPMSATITGSVQIKGEKSPESR